MNTGTSPPMPKVGGSGRTMAVGMGVVATGLLVFYIGQFRVHKNDNQTWILRHGQQPGNTAVPQEGKRIVTATKDLEPGPSPSMPLRNNADNRGSEGIVATVMSMHLQGKGMNPDGRVPENPGNIQQPAPQRRNEDGSHYTKAGYYAESYKSRPKDPNAPKEGRS